MWAPELNVCIVHSNTTRENNTVWNSSQQILKITTIFHFVLWLTEDSALHIERTWQNFLSNSKTFTLHVIPTPNIFSNVQHYWWQPPSSAQFLIYDTKGKSNTFPVKLKTFAFSLAVFWLFIFFSRYYWINLGFGKLPTYPSPKPSFCPKWEVSDNVRLWEG